MTVYVDLLFGLNTLINYLLLRGSAAMGGCPVRLWRLLTAAVMGGMYAVAVGAAMNNPLADYKAESIDSWDYRNCDLFM